VEKKDEAFKAAKQARMKKIKEGQSANKTLKKQDDEDE